VLNKFRTWNAAQRAMAIPFPTKSDLASRSIVDGSAHGQIVAFYTTDSIYENEARRMVASAKRLGLLVSPTPISSAGSWVKNASRKAEFLLSERKAKRGPLLYVDVDAVFHRDPWPALADYDCDVAVHYSADSRLISATILINDTPAAHDLIAIWRERSNANQEIWDQVVLQEIIAEDMQSTAPKFRVKKLPVSFCWIFDRLNNERVETVYIEQLQASREATKEPRLFGRVSKRVARRRERTKDIELILNADLPLAVDAA
jgi:hypothetical protein